jgi:hypothetical protein
MQSFPAERPSYPAPAVFRWSAFFLYIWNEILSKNEFICTTIMNFRRKQLTFAKNKDISENVIKNCQKEGNLSEK